MAKRIRRVKAEAFLNYGPRRSALARLLEESKGQARSDRRHAKYAARYLNQVAGHSSPVIDQLFRGAQGQLAAVNRSQMGSADHLGAQASTLKAILASEGAGAQGRMTVARANALSDVVADQGRRAQGLGYRLDQIRGERQERDAKILTQLTDLDAEEGAFVAKRLGELTDKSKDRRLDRRAQRERERHNRESEAVARDREERQREKDNEKPKRKLVTPQQQGAAKDSITEARHWADYLKGLDYTREEAKARLLEGRPSQTVDGKKLPAIPKTKALWASIALDLAWNGRISSRNARELRKRGYRVKKFGWDIGKPEQGGSGGANAGIQAG